MLSHQSQGAGANQPMQKDTPDRQTRTSRGMPGRQKQRGREFVEQASVTAFWVGYTQVSMAALQTITLNAALCQLC